jgi:hypothetical protein
MSIVTISRGSYSRGEEVAEKVTQKLGCECISREVLVKATWGQERRRVPVHDPGLNEHTNSEPVSE